MSKKFPLAVPFAITLLACAALTASAQTYNTTATPSTDNSTVLNSTDATTNATIPDGYVQQSDGTYYNSSNGLYYDPTTGGYSNSAPTPGLPNTGAGGYAGTTLAILAVLAVLAIGGIAYASRRA